MTNIVFSTSPEYSDFWNLQAKIWRTKFHYNPICLLFGENKGLSEEYGEVHEMALHTNVPKVIQIVWSKFLYPSLRPDDVWIIGDIDMFPLQTDYFKNVINTFNSGRSYIHLNSQGNIPNNDCWSHHKAAINKENEIIVNPIYNRNFPAHYHVAFGDVFQDLYKPTFSKKDYDYFLNLPEYKELLASQEQVSLSDFTEVLWCKEEQRSTEEIQKACNSNHIQFIGTGYNNKIERIDRNQAVNGKYVYNEDLLKEGRYIDLHCLRPYKQYEDQNLEILEKAGMI